MSASAALSVAPGSCDSAKAKAHAAAVKIRFIVPSSL